MFFAILRTWTCLMLAASLNAAHFLAPVTQPVIFRGQSGQSRRERPKLVKSEPAKPATSPSGRSLPEVSDDEIIRTETDLVNNLFTALDNQRHFITTLRQEDVRILENGVPQKIDVFQRETELPLSLALVIDLSKSQERTLPEEQKAAGEFLDTVIRADRDQAAAVSFTGNALMQQGLTNDKTLIRSAINRLKIDLPPNDPECEDDASVEEEPRCWSGIWDAVWASTNEVLSQTPERTRRAVILLTDGDDTSSITKKDELIDFALKHNVTVYGIGIGDRELYKIDEGALRKVCERTGGRAFFPLNDAELRGAFAQIEQELRSQYLIAYSPQNKTRDGAFRQIKIEIINPELRKQKLRLLYRQGYYAKQASPGN
ncbi:MAG: VWA domain-containing protein [Pyrinomonadaceae bacterium]